jgi:raffinose/stachyose/melibiose transport system substrate-binding protein
MRLTIACASAAAVALLAGSAAAQEVVRFATIFDAAAVERWTPVIEEYERANPGVDIQLETTAGSGAAVYPDVLRTSMASGDPPDVFFMWGGSIAQPFIDAGQAKELSAEYEQYGWDDRFPAWIKERLSSDGKIYGVPYHARGMALWYRKDIFAEHGLSVPTTYEELEGVCAKLAENGKYCASFGGKFGWHTMRLVDYFLEDTCGPETHDAINARQESWDQECVVAAFDRLRKWVDNKWLVPDFLAVAPNDARMPMYMGDAAMVYEGGWFEGVLGSDQQDSSNFDFFLPPTASGRYHAFPEQWMISAGAKNPEGAAKFIDWITTPENENRYPDAFAGSATIGVAPDCAVAPHGCKWVEILNSSAGTYPPTDQAFSKELIDSFFEAQDAVVAGRMTGAEAARLIQQRVEQQGG